MGRRLANLTLDNLDDVPLPCRRCVFWELDPVAGSRAVAAGDPGLEKESWVSATLLDWGSCGQIIYVDDDPAGHVLYAPPAYVPRSASFPTSPVAADAVLLMVAHVRPGYAGGGLGRVLVQAVAKDLVHRGIKAIEAFGDAHVGAGEAGGAGTGAAGGAGGVGSGRYGEPACSCLLPVDFLLAVGFKTVRPHHRVPRLRLDLRNALSWREDVEVALERLLGSMAPAPVPTPH
jgi:GNAT superfamily N-acetyltransferase